MGDLIITVQPSYGDNTITFRVKGSGIIYTGSLSVNWGDGTITTETSPTFTHTYTNVSEEHPYEITMSGNITELGNSCFNYATGNRMTNMIIPNGVTSIGESCFEGISIEGEIFIPSSVSNIGNNAFYMGDIYYLKFGGYTPPTIGNGTFTMCNADFYVPTGTISTYKNANYPSSATYNEYTPPIVHNYVIEFDESSYVSCDGSCTVTATLTDNNSAVSGETITLTGTGSSMTATTDSNGIATFNLSSISEDKTLTVTYDEMSDTASLTYNLTTLNGSLTCLGKRMASNLTSKGITGVNYTDGLTSLADEILNIATLDDYEEVELLITYTDTSTETISVLKRIESE